MQTSVRRNQPSVKPNGKPSAKPSVAPSSSEPDKVPLLLYSTSGPNNLLTWKKEITVSSEKMFGRLASIFETNKVYVPKAVKLPAAPFTAENDPFGTKARKLMRKIDKREDSIQKLEENQYPFSAYLWSKLSPPSQQVIKAFKFKPLRMPSAAVNDANASDNEEVEGHADSDGDADDDADASESSDSDSVSSTGSDDSTSAAAIEAMPVTWRSYKKSNHHPLILWRLILATHTGSLTGSAPTDAINALRRYVNLRQRPDQTTDNYKELVDNAIVGMDCTILPKIPEVLLAAMYIDNLE